MGAQTSKINTLAIVKLKPNSFAHKNKLLPFIHHIYSINGEEIKDPALAKIQLAECRDKELELGILHIQQKKKKIIKLPKMEDKTIGIFVKFNTNFPFTPSIKVKEFKGQFEKEDYILGIEGSYTENLEDFYKELFRKKNEIVKFYVFNFGRQSIRIVETKLTNEYNFLGLKVENCPIPSDNIDIFFDTTEFKYIEGSEIEKTEKEFENTNLYEDKNLLEKNLLQNLTESQNKEAQNLYEEKNINEDLTESQNKKAQNLYEEKNINEDLTEKKNIEDLSEINLPQIEKELNELYTEKGANDIELEKEYKNLISNKEIELKSDEEESIVLEDESNESDNPDIHLQNEESIISGELIEENVNERVDPEGISENEHNLNEDGFEGSDFEDNSKEDAFDGSDFGENPILETDTDTKNLFEEDFNDQDFSTDYLFPQNNNNP